jgi:multiple sugar transport system substrate-binding protein
MRKLSYVWLLLATVSLTLAPVLPTGAQQTTLTFFRLGGATHNAYLQPILAAFQKANPAIKIESVEVAGAGYETLAQKISLAIAAGTPPDILQVPYSLVRAFVEGGQVVPFDSLMKADKEFNPNNLFSAMFDLGKIDGRQYLFPLGISTPVLFINVEAFAKAGLDARTPPKTWAEVRSVAEKLKAAGYLGIHPGWHITGNWIFQAMLESAGGRMGSEDGKRVMFNQAPGVRTAEFLADLAKNKLMVVTEEEVIPIFATGRLGMAIESSFQRVTALKTAKFDVRMAPIPTPDGGPPRLPAGGNGIMLISQDIRKMQAAWRFARFLTEAAPGEIIAENSGYLPANRGVVAELRRKYESDANFQVALNQAPQAVPWYNWAGSNGVQISQTIKEALLAVLLERKAPKAALDEAAAQVQALLPR